ncbi:nucleotidyltransferase domain-containing protein, partial [Pseudomonas aeruginosa]|uniref:nucleotidyltransferase domain-containing protein n=1 Tax=Pseudomonas aeruginosa TaxID=287 RepID=UPI0021F130D6
MDMPDGFIPLPPRVEPQAAFRPLLDDLRRTLARPPFERAVHSVYLYGSVARGEAITGRSDLDLTLVLRDPPSPELAAQLETARRGGGGGPPGGRDPADPRRRPHAARHRQRRRRPDPAS